jgi:hypothetical protein
MASTNFTNLTRHLAKADIDFDSVSLKVLLVSSVPTEGNFDSWVARSDVTNEISGTGYTAGGIAQAYTLSAIDTTNNRQGVVYTDNATAWTTATITALGAIIYKDTGSAATDLLMHFIDFGGSQTVTGGTFGLTYTTPFYINR